MIGLLKDWLGAAQSHSIERLQREFPNIYLQFIQTLHPWRALIVQ